MSKTDFATDTTRYAGREFISSGSGPIYAASPAAGVAAPSYGLSAASRLTDISGIADANVQAAPKTR